MNHQNLEALVFELGSKLLEKTKKENNSFLEKNWWYKKMLTWTMRNQSLKTNLFRFIDVLPSLNTNDQILSHLKEYFKGEELGLLSSGVARVAPSLMVKNIKKQISSVAKMFITGSNIEETLKVVSKNWKNDLAFSIDILGEATLSEKEAKAYYDQYSQLMEDLMTARMDWPQKDLLQKDSFGPIPSVNISIKASALFSQIKTEAWDYSKEQIKKRLRPLFQKAVQNFMFINLDMEKYEYKDLFLEIFKELLMEEELKNYPHFGIVIQTYLKESFKDVKELAQFCKKRGCTITVRLVKGAYWDSEFLLAKQKNWPIPVYTNKEETDANFERCMKWLFEQSFLKLAIASHNIRSIAYALSLHKLHPKNQLEFQVLYGMGDSLGLYLKELGYCVRFYCTMGDLIPGMSYLVRRLLENSANQSFILNSMMKNKNAEEILAPPIVKIQEKKKSNLEQEEFKNHPLLDFSKKEIRIRFQQALKKCENNLPIEVPIILDGKQKKSSRILKRENPADLNQIVSQTYLGQKEHVEQAVHSTSSFFKEWKQSSSQRRIDCLKKLISLIKEKEFELSALQVFETGKTWPEAQADVAEAIDFCKYYALSYEQMIKEQKTDDISGEESLSQYEAIGLTAVIAPWNFPLAILTGMTVAPLLCGNTVIIKPAEQSPATALKLSELLLESGFPKQSFAFLPGIGEEVGEELVRHPKVSIISFTGSLEVGSQILKKASQIEDQQKDIKKCILEMGGKNAIVLDNSADLDEAISGILVSAFGFQGQKCSSCSRVIILEEVYEKFIDRFLPAVESLMIGNPKNSSSSLGPLIDESSYERIQKITQQFKHQILYQGKNYEQKGAWFVSPLVFLTDQWDSPLMQEEFFAPVLTVFKVKNLEEACNLVNKTRFGLTAAIYSRHPKNISQFKNLIEVGNIYINRNCTGALVKRHPFGGRKMSGLGSKTGGPEYLKQFLHTKITTENVMRRGFSPELFEKFNV